MITLATATAVLRLFQFTHIKKFFIDYISYGGIETLQ